MVPFVTFNPQGGLFVVYHDSRNDPNNIMTDVYLAASNDVGEIFTDFRITSQSFDPRVGRGGCFMGDYNGITATTEYVYPCWTDMRNGTNQDCYVGIVPLSLVGVPVENPPTPAKFYLNQNYPNPFNGTSSFGFSIAHRSFVTLKVFDMLGREVAMLVNEEKAAGVHALLWSAENLASGAYFYSLTADNAVQTRKAVLLK